MSIRKILSVGFAMAAVLLIGCLGHAQADEYRIGPDDVLEINFWQAPTFNTTVRVNLDGKITLDIIGEVDAAGKTTQELQNDIVRQISRLNKDISQAVVRVVQYNYNYVYVTGQVRNPGKLTFEQIPDLWEIINEAGGPTDVADLSRVTIVRGGDDAGKVEIVDVAKAISTGTLNKLPKVRRMDTIELPGTLGGIPSRDLGRSVEKKNVIYVVGAVRNPGAITYEDNIDVLDAIALAGGPAPSADMSKAKIVTKDGPYAQSLKLNLNKYSTSGKPSRYILQQEDTIILPEKSNGLFGASLGTTAAVIGVVSSVVLIWDRIASH